MKHKEIMTSDDVYYTSESFFLCKETVDKLLKLPPETQRVEITISDIRIPGWWKFTLKNGSYIKGNYITCRTRFSLQTIFGHRCLEKPLYVRVKCVGERARSTEI